MLEYTTTLVILILSTPVYIALILQALVNMTIKHNAAHDGTNNGNHDCESCSHSHTYMIGV